MIPGDHEQGTTAQGLPHQQAYGALSAAVQSDPPCLHREENPLLRHQETRRYQLYDQPGGQPQPVHRANRLVQYGNEDVKPYKIRIQPPLPNDPQKTRRYYESKLASYPDVIDVSAIVDFTGYNRHTVCEWIRFGKLRALALQHKYLIPKCYLIDWLSTDEHNATLRKSRRHIDRLWELQKWSDGQ